MFTSRHGRAPLNSLFAASLGQPRSRTLISPQDSRPNPITGVIYNSPLLQGLLACDLLARRLT